MGIDCFGDSSTRFIRVAWLLLLSVYLLAGCSSRGSAPVYNRSTLDRPVSEQSSQRQRPPAYARTYYLVQPGDTLYSIAWRQDISYRELASWNGIRPPGYRIYPGQRLRLKAPERLRQKPIPRTASRVPPVSTKPASPPPTQGVVRTPPQTRTAVVSSPNNSAPAASPKRLKLTWDWPTNGRVVQTYSAGDDTRKGVWIQGRLGQTVKASESGRVVYAGNGLVGYGNLVIIKHDSSFLSAYGYNSKLLVKEGDEVKKGEAVAQMGTPNAGAQPLLHFEIRRRGKPVNPLPLLPKK